ncbi:isopenicillin-N N-acyltransferase [Senna tora]|uniref:Isopenicillin-N N-acyltransferase n=1 Tax=Senna tora TaxID=362788 RepID=A0A834WP50_9FABA|nr:isopenicillin-N N-acyltransferase [Senna tora]
MESCSIRRETLEMFEVGPCENSYQMGFLIGQRFSQQIRSRIASDLILQNELLPFAQTPQSHSLLQALQHNNRTKFPTYWDELLGTAHGSGVPFLHILLINFRKEILAFIPKGVQSSNADPSEDCSDLLVVSESMAIAAHNEDANVALLGHTYLIKGILPNGLFFVAYTYAGELPSCAFGFNSLGLGHNLILKLKPGHMLRVPQAFTLNSVPPNQDEIVAGGIGRNFVSRDILEATSIDDALNRIRSSEVSVGHSYNLIETSTRRTLNVETASRKRVSVYEVQDENSISRQQRAAVLEKKSKEDFLSLLGDNEDRKYPIYMTGPLLHTLCTTVIDLDDQTVSIITGNPKKGHVSHVFSISQKSTSCHYNHSNVN